MVEQPVRWERSVDLRYDPSRASCHPNAQLSPTNLSETSDPSSDPPEQHSRGSHDLEICKELRVRTCIGANPPYTQKVERLVPAFLQQHYGRESEAREKLQRLGAPEPERKGERGDRG